MSTAGSDADGEDAVGVSPLYQKFEQTLRTRIADGQLKAGTVLLEATLARLFGSSRAPVRQALHSLEQQGLISRLEGRGYVVGAVDSSIPRLELDPEALQLTEPSRKPFVWETIYEQVERTVIQRSVFGQFRVNEVELARHYKVGRTVAHDVLTRIESLGMLEKDDRQRWSIVPLTTQRLNNLYEIREHLEPVALRHAIDVMPTSLVSEMRARLLGELSAYPDVTAEGMDRLEYDLHIEALSLCPNRELIDALRRTRCTLTLSKHILGVELDVPSHDPFLEEHLHVFDAILEGKPGTAVEALRRHIRSSRPKVMQRLEVFQETFSPPAIDFVS